MTLFSNSTFVLFIYFHESTKVMFSCLIKAIEKFLLFSDCVYNKRLSYVRFKNLRRIRLYQMGNFPI